MKHRWLFTTILLFLSVLCPSVLLAQENRGLVIYSNDFERVVGSEWSNTKIDRTPSGRNFLGQFSNGTVSLILTNLPTHHEVTVSFDLFIIQSWDGNQGGPGPDIWDLNVPGGPTLLHTTFSNWPTAKQAYPDTHPGGDHVARTGAAEFNSLGYLWSGVRLDSVYQLSFTFPHSASTLTLNFSGSGLQPIADESWGLDNVKVSVLNVIIPQQISPRTVGESFTLALEAATSANVHTFTFDLKFAPAILRAVRIGPGPFFSKDGADSITCEPPKIDDAAGRITGISCRRNGADGVTGSGVLATITFEALKIGESVIKIENATFAAPDGKPIEFGTRDGSVTVFGPHGRITGRVIDHKGQPVRGVPVLAFKGDAPIGITGQTDSDGGYAIENITAAGEVTVRTRLAGLTPGLAVVPVRMGQTTANVDFVLAQPAGLNSVVDVEGFIRDWLMLGPIPWEDDANRLITDQLAVTDPKKLNQPQEPETKALQPRAGDYSSGMAKTQRWTLHADSDRDIDLAGLYGSAKGVVYAFTLVKSLAEREVTLRLGSDDGVIVWLNDQFVHRNGTPRTRGVDQGAVAGLKLNKGWNRLLIKIDNWGSGWGFLVRFTDAAKTPITDLDISPQLPSGVPVLPSGKYTTQIPLTRGINMLSMPLNPDTPYTASSFAAALGSTIVIRVNDGRFDPYVATGQIGTDFPIVTGQGYIVNITAQSPPPFVITGEPAGVPVPAAPPAGTPSEPWAFVVVGRVDGRGEAFPDSVRPQLNHRRGNASPLQVRVTNRRTGASVVVPISPSGEFVAAFVDVSQLPVVAAGDEIVIQPVGADGRVEAFPEGTQQEIKNGGGNASTVRYMLQQEDLTRAYLLTRLSPTPTHTRLLQNYPNPFNPETWMPYQLASDAQVRITIYDLKGALVRRIDLGHQTVGDYRDRHNAAYWDGRNASGEPVASGIYFYQLKAGDFTATRRMVILK